MKNLVHNKLILYQVLFPLLQICEVEMEGCVSALGWVPRGCAKEFPKKFKPTEEEIAKMKEEMKGR